MGELQSHSRQFMLHVQASIFQNMFWKPMCSENDRQNHGTNIMSRVILNTKMQIQIPGQEGSNMAVTGKGQLRVVTLTGPLTHMTLVFLPEKQFVDVSLLEVKWCWNPHTQAIPWKAIRFDCVLTEKTSTCINLAYISSVVITTLISPLPCFLNRIVSHDNTISLEEKRYKIGYK